MRALYLGAALLLAGCTADLNDLYQVSCADFATKQASCLGDSTSKAALQSKCESAGLSNACRRCVVDNTCSAQATACASACAADGGKSPTLLLETLTGTAVDTFVEAQTSGELSTVSVPNDLSRATLAAWELLPDAGLLQHAGSGTANGSFSVTGLPSGATVYLQWGKTFVQTPARSVDLGSVVGGRPDALGATTATLVSVQLSGLQPFQSTDQLEMAAFNTGFYEFALQLENSADGGPTLPEGATSLSETLDWSTLGWANGSGLPEAAKGDALYTLQLSGSSQSGGTMRVLSRVTSPLPVTLTDGQSGSISAGLEPVPANQSLSLTWAHSSFGNHILELGPGASPEQDSVFISVMPGANQFGAYTFSADLLYFSGAPALNDLGFSASYGNPFPPAWTAFGELSTEATVRYQVPGAPDTFTAYPYMTRLMPVAELTGSQGLELSPPRNVRMGAGSSPVLAWEPPGVGTPTSYRVSVFQVQYDSSAGYSYRSRACSLAVDGSTTHATIPPGLLTSGGSYYAQVTAFADPGDDVAHKPFRHGLAYSSADALSPLFTP